MRKKFGEGRTYSSEDMVANRLTHTHTHARTHAHAHAHTDTLITTLRFPVGDGVTKHKYQLSHTEQAVGRRVNRSNGRVTFWMGHMGHGSLHVHWERKCADTIGTVLVPWSGHFQF